MYFIFVMILTMRIVEKPQIVDWKICDSGGHAGFERSEGAGMLRKGEYTWQEGIGVTQGQLLRWPNEG